METILIVGHDRSEREALAERVAGWGYDPRSAGSAAEARERVQELGSALAAVLLDWRLPDGHGIELLRWIKEQPSSRDLEVIIQSATVVPGEIQRGIGQGAYYFLTKPYSGPQLRALLRSAIGSRELRRKLREQSAEIQDCFRLLSRATFRVRTPADAELLSAHLGVSAGDPQMGVGILELLLNGIEHGNLGISYEEKSRLLAVSTYKQELAARLESPEHRDKVVRVDLQRRDDQLEVVIADSGPGFDYRRYQGLEKDRFFDPHGRGVLLATAILELEYEDPGNRVRVRVPLARSGGGS